MEWTPLSPLRLLLTGLAIVLVAGPVHRFGLLQFRPALGLLGVGVLLILTGAIGVVVHQIGAMRSGGSLHTASLLALIPAILILGFVGRLVVAAIRLPAIHDITTDTVAPPPFTVVASLRAGAPNPSEYDGPAVALLQRQGYPDLGPLLLDRAPDDVLVRAEIVARASGWTIHAVIPADGFIEATATTRWFGFSDDVAVRITPNGPGTRVDMRSKSRVGRSDLGANAARIRKFFRDLQRDLAN